MIRGDRRARRGEFYRGAAKAARQYVERDCARCDDYYLAEGLGVAMRFVEVTINDPKTWSLAAALNPEVSAALDAAQGRSAKQIIKWLSQHATTRVGPRGRQVQVQVNARVFAKGA